MEWKLPDGWEKRLSRPGLTAVGFSVDSVLIDVLEYPASLCHCCAQKEAAFLITWVGRGRFTRAGAAGAQPMTQPMTHFIYARYCRQCLVDYLPV